MNLYIYKFSYKTDENYDVSFIPMLQRRKLDGFGKISLAAMNDIYENDDINIVFASNYGDFSRTLKLIEQKNSQGEVSPNSFTFSVHNAPAGLFSLLNKINSSYNSISAGENTLSAGIIESIITNKKVLFCYAQEAEGLKSLAILFGNEPRKGAVKFEVLKKQGKTGNLTDFLEFLYHKKDFVSEYYTLRRTE